MILCHRCWQELGKIESICTKPVFVANWRVTVVDTECFCSSQRLMEHSTSVVSVAELSEFTMEESLQKSVDVRLGCIDARRGRRPIRLMTDALSKQLIHWSECDRGEDGVMCCQHVNRLDSCPAGSVTHASSVLIHALASCLTIRLQTEASIQPKYRKYVFCWTSLGMGNTLSC